MDERVGPLALRRAVLGGGFAAFLFALWEAYAHTHPVTFNSMPAPSEIVGVIGRNFPVMWPHMESTTTECAMAFLIAAAAGIALGAFVAYSQVALEALYPHVVVFQIIPKVALAPLFIVWLGVGSTSRLSFAIFSSFFPTLISTLVGLQSTRADYIRLCRSLMAPKWRLFLQVCFPFALTHIFSGLKIAVTMAIIGVVVGEFITAQVGLGYIIKFSAAAMEMQLVFAAVALLCVVGLGLYGAVVLAERLVMAKYGP
ncbi:MAG TPA: ABC transporter permease [Alphaproteobacteria bacterium]